MNKDEVISYLNNFQGDARKLNDDIKIIYNFFINETNLEMIANLEHSGILEKALWPNFNEKSPKELIIIIIIIINYKVNQKINVWEYFRSDVGKFNALFESATNFDIIRLLPIERSIFISFLINCFLCLEEKYIQTLCIKLVSMALWLRLSKESVKKLLIQYMSKEYINKWKKLSEVAKEIYITKPCLFMHNIVEGFLNVFENDKFENFENLFFYEKFIEFQIDLLCQIPTRRFYLPILKEKHFLERCLISKLSTLSEGY